MYFLPPCPLAVAVSTNPVHPRWHMRDRAMGHAGGPWSAMR